MAKLVPQAQAIAEVEASTARLHVTLSFYPGCIEPHKTPPARPWEAVRGAAACERVHYISHVRRFVSTWMRSSSLPKGGIGEPCRSPMPPFGGTRDETTTTTTTMEGDADGGTEDPKHVVFRCDPWLASVPLAESTAVEYFSLSPFYQHTCTNESLRARGMRMDDAEELKRSVGVEYVVVAAQPPHLFAIAKRKRSSPTNANILAMYYILDGNVYQSPTLRDVINSRTVRPSRATWNR